MRMLEKNQTPPMFLSANSILAIARVDIFEGLDVPERSLFSFSSKVDSSSSLPLPPPLPLRRGGKFWRRRLNVKLEEGWSAFARGAFWRRHQNRAFLCYR